MFALNPAQQRCGLFVRDQDVDISACQGRMDGRKLVFSGGYADDVVQFFQRAQMDADQTGIHFCVYQVSVLIYEMADHIAHSALHGKQTEVAGIQNGGFYDCGGVIHTSDADYGHARKTNHVGDFLYGTLLFDRVGHLRRGHNDRGGDQVQLCIENVALRFRQIISDAAGQGNERNRRFQIFRKILDGLGGGIAVSEIYVGIFSHMVGYINGSRPGDGIVCAGLVRIGGHSVTVAQMVFLHQLCLQIPSEIQGGGDAKLYDAGLPCFCGPCAGTSGGT